jgi:hypothetical protein
VARQLPGYDLSELQTAVNALEEAIWGSVFAHLKPGEYVEASQTHVRSFDVRPLFAGSDRR